ALVRLIEFAGQHDGGIGGFLVQDDVIVVGGEFEVGQGRLGVAAGGQQFRIALVDLVLLGGSRIILQVTPIPLVCIGKFIVLARCTVAAVMIGGHFQAVIAECVCHKFLYGR